jgi:hypothetical protein
LVGEIHAMGRQLSSALRHIAQKDGACANVWQSLAVLQESGFAATEQMQTATGTAGQSTSRSIASRIDDCEGFFLSGEEGIASAIKAEGTSRSLCSAHQADSHRRRAPAEGKCRGEQKPAAGAPRTI